MIVSAIGSMARMIGGSSKSPGERPSLQIRCSRTRSIGRVNQVMERKSSWTEQDLLDLRGASESSRLEFKESRLLNDSKEKIAQTLSKEASAFANSEGGVIVVGMRE